VGRDTPPTSPTTTKERIKTTHLLRCLRRSLVRQRPTCHRHVGLHASALSPRRLASGPFLFVPQNKVKFRGQNHLSRFAAGFTLIEIMVTIALIAFMVTIALPKISNKNNEIKATVRKLASMTRELRSRAKLQNATYRLVIDMAEEDGHPRHTYYVEKGAGNIVNNYDPKSPPKNLAEQESEAKKAKEHGDELPPPDFVPDAHFSKGPVDLPKGLEFESVELNNLDAPVTTGVVYIHFLPSGFSDEAAIHLKQGEKAHWTLYTQPFTGRMEIMDKFMALKDLRQTDQK